MYYTNRTGQRCGGCIDGYSLVLGSNACKDCSGKDSRLSLIILFAVAGLALVVFLLFFNLTVSIGTINGLMVVANIGKFFQPFIVIIIIVFHFSLNFSHGSILI